MAMGFGCRNLGLHSASGMEEVYGQEIVEREMRVKGHDVR